MLFDWGFKVGSGMRVCILWLVIAVFFSVVSADISCGGRMSAIGVSEDKGKLIFKDDGGIFTVWGVNYDHDEDGRLLEDYWVGEWSKVEEDFGEIKALGANVVRVHLQIGKFMNTATDANELALKRLGLLLKLAEETGLYLDITGLGCYHIQDVPAWYEEMGEAERWEVQGDFWRAVAKTCWESPAVLCYDLMNEPVLSGPQKGESKWLGGKLGDSYFVQRITLDLAGRTREQVAKAWVDKLTGSIREYDKDHLVTVGVIPWAHVWPNAEPLFYSEEVSENLDLVCVHFYPKRGKVEKAIEALKKYDIGKPLIVEEMFPLGCGKEALGRFIDESSGVAEGWISFYWGKTVEEYEKDIMKFAIMKDWLKLFKEKGADLDKMVKGDK
jgi:hypothetical protein